MSSFPISIPAKHPGKMAELKCFMIRLSLNAMHVVSMGAQMREAFKAFLLPVQLHVFLHEECKHG
jgi:hypothetical protein